MLIIELTRDRGWNAPAIATHPVRGTMHIADVQRLAEQLLAKARPRDRGPTGYRIVDASGRRLSVSEP